MFNCVLDLLSSIQVSLGAGGTKPCSIPLRSSKQRQDVGASLDTSTAITQAVASRSQPTEFIEGPVMDGAVDESLYARFQTWKPKCENILEAKLASLPEREYKVLLK